MDNGTEMKTTEQVKSEEEKPAEEVKTVENTKIEENKDEKSNVEEKEAVEIKTEEEEAIKVATEPSEELLEKIKSQVEFYFGDINMQRDKFLTEQVKLDDGWVPMSVMLNFKLLASLSDDAEVILKALETNELIEISEDRKKIRRSPKHPLPVFDEEYKKSQSKRTVYIKGFPLADTNIQMLKDFFKDYEPFENIIMRKYQDQQKKLNFKGSIFVQFKTLEGAQAFLARESVKFGDKELVRKFSEEYSVAKAKENEEKKQKKNEMKVKKAKENDGDSDGDAEQTTDKLDLPKGSIIHFTSTAGEITRELIKESLTQLGGEVAYIDYVIGKMEGWVRLQEANSGKVLVDKMEDNKLQVKKATLTFRVLEGDEETKYLEVVKQTMKDRRLKHKNPKKNHSRRGRNSQRGRKRHASPAQGAVAAKKNASN